MGLIDRKLKKAKTESNNDKPNVIVHLFGESGEHVGTPVDLHQSTNVDQLTELLRVFLADTEIHQDQRFCFFINDTEVTGEVGDTISQLGLTHEATLNIQYRPQALFTVRAVGRCGGELLGHKEAVLSTQFSPSGQSLISGSGDTTIRFWELSSNTLRFTGIAHTHWVLCVAWSPCGNYVATGGKDNNVYVWDPKTGKRIGRALAGHRSYITALAWEPIHVDGKSSKLASSSKDGSVNIWNIHTQCRIFSLTSHIASVTCLVWGGQGYIYSGSQDRTIKVWDALNGSLFQTLTGHSHWINTMALNTSYVLRTGAFDHKGRSPTTPEEIKEIALKRYQSTLVATGGKEVLLTGSDDYTMILWNPLTETKPITRMTGHIQLINHVSFSPDCRYIISASFDKTIRLWDAKTGKFIFTYKGHVGSVYQVAWSADSRMFVSASKDSTLKVWSISRRKQEIELPGHADEVYTVDWSPDGTRVASGGKDKVLKIWTN